jgi:putative redox protein
MERRGKMADKEKELQASVVLVNGRLNFSGTAGSQAPVAIDYIPPLGDNLGYLSLELLLLSLSSCLGSAVLIFLRRMKKEVQAFAIHARGVRRDEHPTGFKVVYLDIDLRSADATAEDVERVVKLAEEKYCPVWAMVKGNVEIVVSHTIH